MKRYLYKFASRFSKPFLHIYLRITRKKLLFQEYLYLQVFKNILPIFTRLSDESLLERCTQCLTQNANECLHSLIWNKCPKETFVSKKRLEISVAQAVAEYNNGYRKTASEMLEALNLSFRESGNRIAHRYDKR